MTTNALIQGRKANKRIIRQLLSALAIFVLFYIICFIVDEPYRKYVRFLYRTFSGDKIYFIGKNFHIFPDIIFLYSFPTFVTILYLIQTFRSNRLRQSQKYLAVLLPVFIYFIGILVDANAKVITCTACDDGRFGIHYNKIAYGKVLIVPFLSCLLILLWGFGKKKNI